MDPDAVIERARGTIDEALLTTTGGGLLGRKVLADEPLLAHLSDDETLQYLLAGAAAPTRVEDGNRQELETTGSYRTLLAVTDDRLLLVAGSADGDRVGEFPYAAVAAVEARRGLLTDTVVVEEASGSTWEVAVGSGSDVAAAADYATERADAADPPPAADGADATDGDGGDLAADASATAPDGSATIDSFLQDAPTSDGAAVDDRPEPVSRQQAPPDDRAGADCRSSTGGDGPSGETADSPADAVPSVGAPSDPGPPDEPSTSGSEMPGDPPAADDAATTGDAGRSADRAALRTDLARELFGAVVEEAAMPSVEGYASGDVARVVGDVEAHHERVCDELAAGELEAARGAAATVEALAREGERLAAEQGDEEATRRIDQLRAETRRLLLDAALDVEDLSVLEGPEPAALGRLLQGVDPDAFEHLVADLWSELGYQTAVTQSSKDEGVDVVARQSTPVEQTVVIQAKRYGPDTKVGRDGVQQYASLHRQEPDADLVVVVTTGEFTDPAREAATDLDVKLVDGDRLVEILLERELYGLVARYA